MLPRLTALLCVLAALALPGTPASAETPTRPATSGRTVHLAGDHHGVVRRAPEASGNRRAARANPTWPRGTIRYYETVPAKWQWGLDRAIQTWNRAGGKIRFVEVHTRRKAQVTIGYGNTHGYDGYGTWWSNGRHIVRGTVTLSPKYKRVDHLDDEQRVWVGRLFAHELGHVLGFDHTRAGCSLMVPYFNFDLGCGPLSEDKPGYYPCRWIDQPLLQRFIRLYGGRAQRPAATCLVHPLPPELSGVTFGGGSAEGGAPVTASWGRAGLDPLGAVRVAVWPATSCGAEPDGAAVYTVRPGTRSWTDPATPASAETVCVRVQSVNHSGIGRAGAFELVTRGPAAG